MSRSFARQTPETAHLVTPGKSGVAGEVADLRRDVEAAFSALESTTTPVHKSGSVPVMAANTSGIKTTFASSTSALALVAADFDGIYAPGTSPATFSPPRRPTLTCGAGGTPANFTGGSFVFTGTRNGAVVTETVVAAAGAGTTTCSSYFDSVTGVTGPAQGGTAAQLTLGVAAELGAIASFSTSTSARTVPASAYNSSCIGQRSLALGRQLAVTTSSHADVLAGTVTITGMYRGVPVQDSVTIPGGGGTTVYTNKVFDTVTKIDAPVGGGTNGVISVGIKDTTFALPGAPISSDATILLKELSRANSASAYAVPTAGTLAVASPNAALYTPNAAALADGVRDYVISYVPA